ncbi:hypothetical protein ANN_04654 [Periplaneta americana]|uniref:Uncharacterized protein n=1 Tax=Periplaneta americana TaxID=6978 RepID=A0ABQ8T907_PERAM|nr:hypothetical protein ANN_04654 [Periplaneta americana]
MAGLCEGGNKPPGSLKVRNGFRSERDELEVTLKRQDGGGCTCLAAHIPKSPTEEAFLEEEEEEEEETAGPRPR